jgi:hypothetical protein
METAASIERRLIEAEQLLLVPTVANLERTAEQVGAAVPIIAALTRAIASIDGSPAAEVTPELLAFAVMIRRRVLGLSGMLTGAWQIRLSLARAATAGLAGYSAAGDAEERQEGEAHPRLAATA